jgi:predicted nuclease with TOPRIM domain
MEQLQERLQQLNLERMQLSRSFDQITGAMIEVERQIQELASVENVEEEPIGNPTDTSS